MLFKAVPGVSIINLKGLFNFAQIPGDVASIGNRLIGQCLDGNTIRAAILPGREGQNRLVIGLDHIGVVSGIANTEELVVTIVDIGNDDSSGSVVVFQALVQSTILHDGIDPITVFTSLLKTELLGLAVDILPDDQLRNFQSFVAGDGNTGIVIAGRSKGDSGAAQVTDNLTCLINADAWLAGVFGIPIQAPELRRICIIGLSQDKIIASLHTPLLRGNNGTGGIFDHEIIFAVLRATVYEIPLFCTRFHNLGVLNNG